MILQLGDINQDVAQVQKMLSLLGYDLVIDGEFGLKTLRSVKAFQKKFSLLNDGVVDTNTFNTLIAAQKKVPQTVVPNQSANSIRPSGVGGYPFEVVTQHRLSQDQYIQQITEKTQIFLHFTASGPSAIGVIDWWQKDQPRVATPFVIDRETGTIYECYSPDFWSYHLGIKGTKGILDKSSIGIELCAYGPLLFKNNKYYAWPNNFSTKTLPEGNVYKLQKEYRGFSNFEALTDSQILSCEKLLEFLVQKYNIEVQEFFDFTWFDYDEEVIVNKTPGIWTHSTVRKDKTDLYPDARIVDMLNRISKKFAK